MNITEDAAWLDLGIKLLFCNVTDYFCSPSIKFPRPKHTEVEWKWGMVGLVKSYGDQKNGKIVSQTLSDSWFNCPL